MKKLLTVTGLTLLALAGCQSGGELKGDDVTPAEGTVNEVVLPPVNVNEVSPTSATESTGPGSAVNSEAPVVDDSAAPAATTQANY